MTYRDGILDCHPSPVPFEIERLSLGDTARSLVFQMQVDGRLREVCRFQVVDGVLDIKVPEDLPMTRTARCFLSMVRENFGL